MTIYPAHSHSFVVNSPPYTQEYVLNQIHQHFLATELQLDPPTPTKEPMSTIDKIRAERREKREREELEAKFEGWDAALGGATDGDVYVFGVDLNGKVYRYAVIYTNERWYLTGQETCGFATEDFIAWLITKDVRIENFTFTEPMT